MQIADDASAAEVAILLDVSRETAERLKTYVDGLRRWQRITNLVGPATLPHVWQRHIADSLQLGDLTTESVWVDLGSGAGLPGLVLAISHPERSVHLVESDGRKCAFLREMVRLTNASARVWDGRIEAVIGQLSPAPMVVTARALAPLTSLLALSQSLLRTGTTGLFPKGQGYLAELTEARKSWRFECDILPSRTDSSARILRITKFDGERDPVQANRIRGQRPEG